MRYLAGALLVLAACGGEEQGFNRRAVLEVVGEHEASDWELLDRAAELCEDTDDVKYERIVVDLYEAGDPLWAAQVVGCAWRYNPIAVAHGWRLP